MTPKQAQQLRSLPAVGELLETEKVTQWCRSHGRAVVVDALRAAVDRVRADVLGGDGETETACDTPRILSVAHSVLRLETTPSLRPVINATGVVLHTGLGRAPLCEEAVQAIVRGAGGYCNLEYDLETGKRGQRTSHIARLLCKLTGAEAAAVVNNNAAAVLLTMRGLCDGREVIVSRGQLVEIGGSFRMPEVMIAGGAILREVGTTNRTRISDYAGAINDNTAALLRVHHSNFRIVGFSEEASIEQIVRCAHEHNLIAIDDVGSGAMFDLARVGLPAEPHVGQSVAAGADIVCFSGDKLLGGPQAGIILGRQDLVARLQSHPLMRTYRVDKMVLLALEATLRRYADPDEAVEHIPTLSMIHASTETLARRAGELDQMLADALPGEEFFMSSDVSFAGGGSLPGEGLPTVVIRWQPTFAPVDAVAAALRRTEPPVIVRVHDQALCFDLRTIRPRDFQPLTAAARKVTPDDS